jgi:MFS family permease
VIVFKKNVINRFVEFIKRQPKPFKVNMLRASGNAFLSNLTDQFRSIYILRLGAEAFQLGLVNSIAGIASAAIALPAGWLADRRGIRNMFLLATPLLALGSLLFAVASDWTMAIPAMFLTILAFQLSNSFVILSQQFRL